MTYHRLLTHRSWNCPKLLEKVFVIFETLMMTGSAISWVAVHREHHRFTDAPKDPHSPHYKGFFKVHFLSMFVPVKIKYSVDLVRQPFYKFQHKYYFLIVAIYALTLAFFDPSLLITMWLAPSAIVWNLGSLIVSFSHRKKKPLDSTLLGILSFGEGWHGIHHAKPNLKHWHRFDIGGWLIIAIEKCSNLKAR